MASAEINPCEEDRQAQQPAAGDAIFGAPMADTDVEPIIVGTPLQDIKHGQEAQAQEQKQIPVWHVTVLTIRFAPSDVLELL